MSIELTMMVPDNAVRALKEMSFLLEKSEAEILNRAIEYYKLVTQETLAGSKLLIEKPDGTFRIISED